MVSPARGVFARALVLATLAATVTRAAQAADSQTAGYVDPRLGPSFRTTVEWAAQRFQEATCSALLEDFVDGRTGQPLATSLAASGLSPGAFLSSLYFLDGTGTALCGRDTVMAHTIPGAKGVLVCRAQFLDLQKKNRGAAARVLLHETLHTLGLFENPPHPFEINEKVHARCGW